MFFNISSPFLLLIYNSMDKKCAKEKQHRVKVLLGKFLLKGCAEELDALKRFTYIKILWDMYEESLSLQMQCFVIHSIANI